MPTMRPLVRSRAMKPTLRSPSQLARGRRGSRPRRGTDRPRARAARCSRDWRRPVAAPSHRRGQAATVTRARSSAHLIPGRRRPLRPPRTTAPDRSRSSACAISVAYQRSPSRAGGMTPGSRRGPPASPCRADNPARSASTRRQRLRRHQQFAGHDLLGILDDGARLAAAPGRVGDVVLGIRLAREWNRPSPASRARGSPSRAPTSSIAPSR